MLESQPVVAFVMNDDSEPPAVEKHGQQLVSALAVLGKTHQLFIIPVAFQYISRGWRAKDSSMHRTITAALLLRRS
jgi:hypothetical protein